MVIGDKKTFLDNKIGDKNISQKHIQTMSADDKNIGDNDNVYW